MSRFFGFFWEKTKQKHLSSIQTLRHVMMTTGMTGFSK